MRDLWNLFRTSGPQSQALFFSYEKCGLTLDNQPIPWNAEAVLVEASVRLSASLARHKTDFRLRLGPTGVSYQPELLRQEPGESLARLFFRLPVPPLSTTAELTWRDRTLGQITLPIVSLDDFLRQLQVQMPSAHVRLGEQTIACQTFVSGQCQALTVTSLLSSPAGLVPLADMDLRIEVRREDGGLVSRVPVRFTSSQLRSRQALVAVMPPRPRRTGAWQIQWLLDDHLLTTHRIRAISKRHFLRSLRVSTTRFVVQAKSDAMHVVRVLPPLDAVQRVGPCFMVSSGEPGMAGLANLRVRARLENGLQASVLHEREQLVTDGPLPLFPGTVPVSELAHVKHFALESTVGTVGILPLAPVPSASFTSE
ncbi:MAG TPA: hypothetical protein VK898_03030, partial [Chloroflexota bacterium]|nr:hypothetical protein [Chloroflexota bacterium]